MKKTLALIAVMLTCGLVHADDAPMVGLWEQMAVTANQGESGPVRVDIVVTNRRIEKATTFTALAAAGTKAEIFCCVRVDTPLPVTLPQLLDKYPWDDDDTAHLKSITGGKYIYEARLAAPAEQNASMRNLVRYLGIPPALSPYSAAVIAADFRGAEQTDMQFSVGARTVVLSIQWLKSKDTMEYAFTIDGKRTAFTESTFPE